MSDKLLEALDVDKADQVNTITWENYESLHQDNTYLCASLLEYRDDLKQTRSTLSPALSGSFATNASATSPTVYVLFNDTPAGTEQFKSTAEKHKIEKHPVRLIETVYSNLLNIDTDKGELFQKLVREFRASGPDIQYMRLMDIRSLIFDQLFETLCPESDYSRTDWFQNAPSGSIQRRKRCCQPKYFILGNTAFASLVSILQNQVDTVCQSLFDLFNNLSNYGKHGIDDMQTNVFFIQTITAFSQALELRDSFHS